VFGQTVESFTRAKQVLRKAIVEVLGVRIPEDWLTITDIGPACASKLAESRMAHKLHRRVRKAEKRQRKVKLNPQLVLASDQSAIFKAHANNLARGAVVCTVRIKLCLANMLFAPNSEFTPRCLPAPRLQYDEMTGEAFLPPVRDVSFGLAEAERQTAERLMSRLGSAIVHGELSFAIHVLSQQPGRRGTEREPPVGLEEQSSFPGRHSRVPTTSTSSQPPGSTTQDTTLLLADAGPARPLFQQARTEGDVHGKHIGLYSSKNMAVTLDWRVAS
jgi:hypothetical protein